MQDTEAPVVRPVLVGVEMPYPGFLATLDLVTKSFKANVKDAGRVFPWQVELKIIGIPLGVRKFLLMWLIRERLYEFQIKKVTINILGICVVRQGAPA